MEILVSWCLKKVEFNSHKVSKLKTFPNLCLFLMSYMKDISILNVYSILVVWKDFRFKSKVAKYKKKNIFSLKKGMIV